MIGSTIPIHESGTVPRNLMKAHRRASKAGWMAAGYHFHSEMRPKRFTEQHAIEARYTLRRGQAKPRGSKAWKRLYYGRKFLSPKHGGGPNQADPLVHSGESRGKMRTATITATSKGGKVKYPRTNLNWRLRKSRVRMPLEFSLILPREADDLALTFDLEYSQQLNRRG